MLLRLLHPASAALGRLASQCAICRSWPAQRVCAPCAARFARPALRCPTCALEQVTVRGPCADCMRQPPPLQACFAAVPYAFPWSGLIAGYKFGGDPAWARVFAAQWPKVPGPPAHLAAYQHDDWWLPMPLSAERLQSRGFNQAWELVKALAAQSGTHARSDARLLLRIRNTLPQAQLTRSARLQNVRHAFAVEPLRSHLLKGRRVLLVDDVMTSGASLFAAARSLRDAGAAEVSALVFARTQ